MANKNATGKTARHGKDLTARTRGCILSVFDILDNRNKPMPELLADKAEENPLQFMNIASKYIIKDVHNDVDSFKDAAKLTDSELADIIATRARERLESTVEPVTAPLKTTKSA